MRLEEAISIAERINLGIADATTQQARFTSLWQYPLLCDAYLDLLRGYELGEVPDFDRDNFANICRLFDPAFADILTMIDIPDRVDVSVVGSI